MAVDPLMLEWLTQQGQGQSPPYMQQKPFPNRMGGTPPPVPAAPQAPAQADSVAMPGRMTPQDPVGGLPRPIVQPKNQGLYGSYTSTYQQGRQMGQPSVPPQPGQPGWAQPQPEAPPPLYLDNAGNTTAPTGQIQPQPVSPEDQWMARHFPRATSLAQQLSRMQGLQEAQAIAAATPPPPGPAGPAGQPGKMGPRGPMGPARPPLQGR